MAAPPSMPRRPALRCWVRAGRGRLGGRALTGPAWAADVPLDPLVRELSDAGQPITVARPDHPAVRRPPARAGSSHFPARQAAIYRALAAAVVARLPAQPLDPSVPDA